MSNWTKINKAELSQGGTVYGYGTQAYGTTPYGGSDGGGLDWTKIDKPSDTWTKITKAT